MCDFKKLKACVLDYVGIASNLWRLAPLTAPENVCWMKTDHGIPNTWLGACRREVVCLLSDRAASLRELCLFLYFLI